MKQTDVVKLQMYLWNWRATQPYRWQQGAQAVANDLLQDAAFTDIKVARLLETPGGGAIAQAVQSVLPFPGNAEAAVMIEAIKIAAKKQTSSQVVGALAIGVLVTVVLLGLFGDS